MSLFHRQHLKDQINSFIEDRAIKKNYGTAMNHKEWLVKFAYIIHKRNVFDLTVDDIYIFEGWLLDRYSGDFLREQALHSVRCFLRFYKRYDVLNKLSSDKERVRL